MIAHPPLRSGEFFRERESTEMLARRFLSCPSRPAPHRHQDPIAGNVRSVGRDDRRSTQQSRHARCDDRGVAVMVVAGGRTGFFVQGDDGGDRSGVESVIALNGRIAIVKVQIVGRGRVGRNGMNGVVIISVAVDVAVAVADSRSGSMSSSSAGTVYVLLQNFLLGIIFLDSITNIGASSEQRSVFRNGFASSSSSSSSSSSWRFGIDAVVVTLQIGIHGECNQLTDDRDNRSAMQCNNMLCYYGICLLRTTYGTDHTVTCVPSSQSLRCCICFLKTRETNTPTGITGYRYKRFV